MPHHGKEALKVNLKRLETHVEVSQKRHGVQTLNHEQIMTIYSHASDFQKLLVLLGLNAAMSHAEIISLRWDELEGDPLTIKRIRRPFPKVAQALGDVHKTLKPMFESSPDAFTSSKVGRGA